MTDDQRERFEETSIKKLYDGGFSVAALQAVYPHIPKERVVRILGVKEHQENRRPR